MAAKNEGTLHPDASQYRDGPVEHRIAPQSGQDADKNADDHGQGHGHYGQYYGIGERLSDDAAHVQAVALVRLAQVRELEDQAVLAQRQQADVGILVCGVSIVARGVAVDRTGLKGRCCSRGTAPAAACQIRSGRGWPSTALRLRAGPASCGPDRMG